jgi:RHH-type transcriptional regulator, rel operon repressor / antitoxin RelB
MATLSLRIDPALKKRLDKLAEATNRSKSYLAEEAIKNFVSVNEWQIAEIKKAIKEADEGNFASDAEVKRVFNKLKKRAR